MTTDRRVVLAALAVTLFAVVNIAALALGSAGGRAMLLLCAVVAVVAAVQCAAWDPALLTWAIAFSLPPITALAGEGSSAWLIGPLGALLLLGAELNTLSWEFHGPAPEPEVIRHRLRRISLFVAAGMLSALGVSAAALTPLPPGVAVLVLGGVALAGAGWLLFGRGVRAA